ncbi:MAG: hypothetical protein FJ161_00640 [Gammaproteobacteria bacterium]|nr:hypothetical protein [Gammaproteobacteria bacterium]
MRTFSFNQLELCCGGANLRGQNEANHEGSTNKFCLAPHCDSCLIPHRNQCAISSLVIGSVLAYFAVRSKSDSPATIVAAGLGMEAAVFGASLLVDSIFLCD